MIASFIGRMLPERRQVLNSSILSAMGGSVIWGATFVPPSPAHWVVQTGGLFLVYSGLAPLITRPVGVVTDAIADWMLGLTQPLRQRAKDWWLLQWHFHGDRQQLDRVMRNDRRHA